MRGIIFAMSPEGVIGVGGTIPWRYSGDVRRFKRVTLGSTLVMGRITFESIGKALDGRRNVVVTRASLSVPRIECVRSVREAIMLEGDADLWFIGGAAIYREAMEYADVIDVTYVTDVIDAPAAVYAPAIDAAQFAAGPLLPHEDDPALTRRLYTRIPNAAH